MVIKLFSVSSIQVSNVLEAGKKYVFFCMPQHSIIQFFFFLLQPTEKNTLYFGIQYVHI